MKIRCWWAWGGGALVTLGGVLVVSCTPAPSGHKAAAWEAPTRADRVTNPVPPSPTSIAAGRMIYQQQCLACHGDAGKGDGQAAVALKLRPADLTAPGMRDDSDGALYWKVSGGHRPMPSFEDLLTVDQRWQVVDYIRTFTARPPHSPPRPTHHTPP